MLLFILGIMIGVLAMLLPVYRARRAAEHIEMERQKVSQERQLVVDFMHHMAQALGEGLRPEQLHQRIVHAAILCSGALSACIFERSPNREMRSVAVEGLFPPHRPLSAASRDKLTTRAKFIEQVLRTETFPDHEGIVGAVVQSGKGQLIADAEADPRVVRHADPALRVRSVIAVPMTFRERFFGVLAVANSAGGTPFTQNDFSLMQSLAEQAALALHNADFLQFQIEKKQLDLDLSLAGAIQQMLLPKEPPQMASLDVDARYAAAQKVGGDLYDLIKLSDTRLGVAVADVSGKGIPASLLMAICRTALRQCAPLSDSPVQVLTAVNRVIGGEIRQDMFITVLYAVVDTERDEVTFARAGHELPLFSRRNAQTGVAEGRFVASEGMPLGLVSEEVFASTTADHTEPFHPGDALVLYTDGLTEAPNEEDREFTGARLADAVRILHHRSAREMNDGILEHARRFTGNTPQRDDLTLVTIRRL